MIFALCFYFLQQMRNQNAQLVWRLLDNQIENLQRLSWIPSLLVSMDNFFLFNYLIRKYLLFWHSNFSLTNAKACNRCCSYAILKLIFQQNFQWDYFDSNFNQMLSNVGVFD